MLKSKISSSRKQSKRHSRSRRLGALVLATALFLALGGGAALAATTGDDDTSIVLTGGELSITDITVTDFTGITLDGTAQTDTIASPGFGVTDARGTGAGWHVTVQASQFSTGGETAKTLPYSSLSMPQYTVVKADETSSAVPSLVGTGPFLIDAATATTIASAAADGTGMGSYTFTSGGNMTLSVNASAYAGTYTSTITITVVTGPAA